ncbi:MAG: hypothetical protein LLG09_02310 [Negativicutes bacterium]|nr:hypothetical protein [Negativicutes bacterium]
MTKFRKILALTAMVLTISAGSLNVYAASTYQTAAEAVAGLTGRTLESVTTEKSGSGSSYGSIAFAAGVLTEFKTELFAIKQDQLAAQVAAGKMTQSEADALLAAWQQNQVNCSGSGIGSGSGMQNGRAIHGGLGSAAMTGDPQQNKNRGLINGNGQNNGTGAASANNVSQNRLRNQSCLVSE